MHEARSGIDYVSTLPSTGSVAVRPLSRDRTRLFHAGAASVMLIAVPIGFRHFFFHGTAYPGVVARSIDRWYVIGYGVLASTQLLVIQFARTRVWDQFASFLLR
jgi:hypothetical protein